MKYSYLIVIIALLSFTSSIIVKDSVHDSTDVTDLFNDNSDEAETMKSIAAAEKAHGVKLDAKEA